MDDFGDVFFALWILKNPKYIEDSEYVLSFVMRQLEVDFYSPNSQPWDAPQQAKEKV